MSRGWLWLLRGFCHSRLLWRQSGNHDNQLGEKCFINVELCEKCFIMNELCEKYFIMNELCKWRIISSLFFFFCCCSKTTSDLATCSDRSGLSFVVFSVSYVFCSLIFSVFPVFYFQIDFRCHHNHHCHQHHHQSPS